MEEDDDFTFPTVAASRAPEGQPASLGGDDDGPVVARRQLLQLPLLPDLATAASPLWPFAGSAPKETTVAPSSSPPVAPDEEAPVSGSTGRAEEDKDEPRVAADEETMDLLWEGTAAATEPRSVVVGGGCPAHAAEPAPKQQRRAEAEAEDDDDKRRAAAVADAERMDKLWESFNEELLLLRRRGRARARSAADDPVLEVDHWYLCDYSPSEDAESEATSASSPAERRAYGCAPTMLRASSRAGGAGQFCGSPRSRRRRSGGPAAGWALLLRLFRRLFAVDKTSSAPSRSRGGGGIYMP